jgi:hypothetical protein
MRGASTALVCMLCEFLLACIGHIIRLALCLQKIPLLALGYLFTKLTRFDVPCVSLAAESLTEHFKRRAAVIAERVELELTVAGTEYAPLERAVFKSTKNNTKTPKEKHVIGRCSNHSQYCFRGKTLSKVSVCSSSTSHS